MANSKTKKEQSIALIGIQMYLPVTEGLNAMEVIGVINQTDPFACPKCREGIMRTKAKPPV